MTSDNDHKYKQCSAFCLAGNSYLSSAALNSQKNPGPTAGLARSNTCLLILHGNQPNPLDYMPPVQLGQECMGTIWIVKGGRKQNCATWRE